MTIANMQLLLMCEGVSRQTSLLTCARSSNLEDLDVPEKAWVNFYRATVSNAFRSSLPVLKC